MKLQVMKGSTSVRLMVFVADSSSTTGAGLTGLSSGTSGLKWTYWRGDSGNSGGVSVTLTAGTRGTWASGGIVEIDGTNMPGWYEIGVPNNALATGANSVGMHLMGATNMAPLPLEIQLTGFDPNNATSLGLANLDATISSRLSAASYTAPSSAPTVVEIRSEMDANSTRLAKLDAEVSSRLSTAGYTAADNAGIAAIKERTDRLPDSPAGVGAAMTIEDGAIRDESFTLPTVGSGQATGLLGRMEQVWRYFFKKATLGGGVLRTYADDGTTVLTSQTVSDNGQTQTREEAA